MADDDPFRRAYDLHVRGGRSAAAEAGYREAIAAGDDDAWLYLGDLLGRRWGRTDDEIEAYEHAVRTSRPSLASQAALRLGDVLLLLRGDERGAREHYAFAEHHGSFDATARLAWLDARAGHGEAARDRLRSYAVWYGDRREVDMEGASAEAVAKLVTFLGGHPLTRDACFFARALDFRRHRLCNALVAGSNHATGLRRRIRDGQAKLARRFWGTSR